MFSLILSISEFATKLVAGLSGTIFALLILGLVFGAKNRVPKNINLDELRRKTKDAPETENTDKKGKKSKSDKSKNKAESTENKQDKPETTPENKSDNAQSATEKKEAVDKK